MYIPGFKPDTVGSQCACICVNVYCACVFVYCACVFVYLCGCPPTRALIIIFIMTVQKQVLSSVFLHDSYHTLY